MSHECLIPGYLKSLCVLSQRRPIFVLPPVDHVAEELTRLDLPASHATERCGKSTVAAAILPNRFPTDRFLNADHIARALATDSRFEAGRVMLRRMRELRNQRENFAFETTLAGKTHAQFLRQTQASGYLVHIAYIWLSSVELAKSRVASRRRSGRGGPR